jgi:hypothetical protein
MAALRLEADIASLLKSDIATHFLTLPNIGTENLNLNIMVMKPAKNRV